MSEDDFVKIVTKKLIPLRNDNAHFELSPKEREIGFSILIQSSTHPTGVVLEQFLEYSQGKTSNIELNHKILQEAKGRHNFY
jgi:hypothetical protein